MIAENDIRINDKDNLLNEIQGMEEEYQEMLAHQQDINAFCEEIQAKIEEAERLKEITQLGINQLENEIQEEKRLAFEDRAILEDLRRNRDIL